MFQTIKQVGVPWCVVPLHTPGVGPTCLESSEPYNCSVIDNKALSQRKHNINDTVTAQQTVQKFVSLQILLKQNLNKSKK